MDAELRGAVRRGVQLGAWFTGAYLVYTSYVSIHRYGGFAKDAHAYWLTAHTSTLYRALPGSPDAFLYSPVFAQVIHPLALLPFPWFAGTVIGADLAAFVWLLLPLDWAWAAPVLLLTTPDLVSGQVTGIIAVAVVLAVLGRPGWWSVGWLTKIIPGAIGAVWCLARRDWRGFAVAAATTGAVCVVSFVLWPSAWVDWVRFLAAVPSSPGSTARELAAVLLVLLGARRGWWWVIPVGLVVSAPVYGGFYILTSLTALARLSPSARAARAARVPREPGSAVVPAA